MSIIQADHLTFSYPGSYDTIFDQVSFQIDTEWKLGFVGRNGRGKTTFLNLLMGKYEYSGTIHTSVQFDYFPYPIADKTRITTDLLTEVCPAAEEWELLREFAHLAVDADVLWRPFNTLSNGEQTKVLLAALFLNKGHFLLIDEPTNHLDSGARALVAAYLKKKKGFILVSHDRAFLDGCVDHILSINRSNIEVQSGTFSSWFQNFEQQQEHEQMQNARLKKEIGRLQAAAARTSTWSEKVEATKAGAYDKGYIGHKAAKMMQRSKSIESRQKKAIEEKSKLLQNVETADRLKLTPLLYHANRLAEFQNTVIQYGESPVNRSVSFDICRGDRIALTGRNGCGKSSILKCLTGQVIPHSGTVAIGSGLQISYIPQDTAFLCGDLSAFAQHSKIDESLFKAILRKLDFERVQFEKDMSNYSAGQKKKVLIAKSLCEQAHLYIWDEPLNYIDIYSRMQIEALLTEFAPTMIFVEHDQTFTNQIATKTIAL